MLQVKTIVFNAKQLEQQRKFKSLYTPRALAWKDMHRKKLRSYENMSYEWMFPALKLKGAG